MDHNGIRNIISMKKGKEDDEHNILKAYNMLLYFAGTMVMFDPSTECIQDFWTNGILKNLPVSSGNPRFLKAASQLRESLTDNKSSYEMMKIDYFILFTATKDPLAPPLESSFREKSPLRLNKDLPGVIDFYNSYGWVSKFRNHIPDDHIGVELLFLTLMVEKYLEFDDEACHTEMKNEIRRFIDLHLFTWVPEWNNKIQSSAKTLSYKGIGTLIQACTEDIYGIMAGTLRSGISSN
jgi:TorA maturation chaperone TorD